MVVSLVSMIISSLLAHDRTIGVSDRICGRLLRYSTSSCCGTLPGSILTHTFACHSLLLLLYHLRVATIFADRCRIVSSLIC